MVANPSGLSSASLSLLQPKCFPEWIRSWIGVKGKTIGENENRFFLSRFYGAWEYACQNIAGAVQGHHA